MPANLQGVHPVLASNDVVASVQFYCRLGFVLLFQDNPTEPVIVHPNRNACLENVRTQSKVNAARKTP